MNKNKIFKDSITVKWIQFLINIKYSIKMLDKCDFITSAAKMSQVGICFNPFFTFALDNCDFSFSKIFICYCCN